MKANAATNIQRVVRGYQVRRRMGNQINAIDTGLGNGNHPMVGHDEDVARGIDAQQRDVFSGPTIHNTVVTADTYEIRKHMIDAAGGGCKSTSPQRTPQEIEAFEQQLKRISTLKDDVRKDICRVYKNDPTLTELDLYNNNIGDEGAKAA